MKVTDGAGWRGETENTDQVRRRLLKSSSKTDHPPVQQESTLPYDNPVRQLGQDQIVRWIMVALACASVPILTPVLSNEWQGIYGQHIVTLPFLVGVLLAFRFRLRSVEEVGEQRFWKLLTLGFASWMVALLIGPVGDVLLTDTGILLELVKNAPYILFYSAMAAALEIHPHVRQDPLIQRLRTLDRIGSFVLLFGLLIYFLVVPRVVGGSSSTFWASSLALFVSLDVYFILRLWHLQGSTRNHEWRVIYQWLLIGTTIWGIGDLMLSLMYERILTDPGWGTPFDLIWPLSFSAVMVATRPTSAYHKDQSEVTRNHQPLGMGPLVVYAVAPLLSHVALHRFGVPDPEFRMPREMLALGTTAILAVMALAYHRLLHHENSRLAIEEALTREKLAHQAFHDELTGLPNRNLFRDRLQSAIDESIRYGSKCAVFFCDLDHFKVINDSLGHEAGDQALIAISDRLRSSVRKHDTVARFGGDEFAIIVQSMHQVLDAAFLAEKLLAVISTPLLIGRSSHTLTASIGIAVFPDDGEYGEVLLKYADTAMYQGKLHGRNTYKLFTDAMNQAVDERLAIEQGLRTGLIEDQFEVFYQPIVELATNQPVAYEALLRWHHPRRGYISPANFIDVAEQTGHIVQIGHWVLETACTWAAQLDSIGGVLPSISVNISPRQFRDSGLIEAVHRVLESTELDATRLQLEITESMALTFDSAAETLSKLRELGVRIAIDDFGTGYAALSLLQDFPVDIVKIDGSFVKGIEVDSVSEAIVLAIVNMARALNFYLVAEGVETESELNIIRQSKCNAVQGFYVCYPLPPEKLEKTIISHDAHAWIGSGLEA